MQFDQRVEFWLLRVVHVGACVHAAGVEMLVHA